jgi:hypothetical protein
LPKLGPTGNSAVCPFSVIENTIYESKKNVRRFRIPLKMVIKFNPILKTIVTNITPLGYFKFSPLHIVYNKLMRTKL